MVSRDISRLIAAEKIGLLTAEEGEQLRLWRAADRNHELIYQQTFTSDRYREDLLLFDQLDSHLASQHVLTKIKSVEQKPLNKRRSLKVFRIPAAAAILLISFACLWFFNKRNNTLILPGSTKAYISLNGKDPILLDGSKGEIIISDSLLYADGSGLALQHTAADQQQEIVIATPKGGEYKVILSDQTKIVLNAASTVRFPKKFAGKQRLVELEGEAYFDVAKVVDQKHERVPFLVKTKQQVIQVFGTQFNVSSYAEDSWTQTTLIEGSVAVSATAQKGHHVRLVPGEMATTDHKGTIQTQKVDISTYIAWTKNQFVFTSEPLDAVMAKLARWYDLEYSFQNPTLKNERVEGILPRFGLAKDLFKLLEDSGNAHFEIKGRKVLIY